MAARRLVGVSVHGLGCGVRVRCDHWTGGAGWHQGVDVRSCVTVSSSFPAWVRSRPAAPLQLVPLLGPGWRRPEPLLPRLRPPHWSLHPSSASYWPARSRGPSAPHIDWSMWISIVVPFVRILLSNTKDVIYSEREVKCFSQHWNQ